MSIANKGIATLKTLYLKIPTFLYDKPNRCYAFGRQRFVQLKIYIFIFSQTNLYIHL
jgi:hypothetical protein